jgi:broad specificity phosphatase PhoE
VKCLLAAFLIFVVPAHAAIYVVRHAEKVATDKTKDPPLTQAGAKRAKDLARALRTLKLKEIYATEFLRTRQTAAPTAKAAGLKISQVKSDETEALADRLKLNDPKDDVLVVAHSDTIPNLLRALGVGNGPKEELDSKDYDNLFVVDLSSGASLHWLHYGPANP